MLSESWLVEPSTARKRLIFARHGEYTCNVAGVVNSDPRASHPLTERGQAQALALAERLKDEGIELIVTSELLRARQTAWIVNQTLKVPQVVNRLANEAVVGRDLEGRPAHEFLGSIAHAPATACAHDGEPFMGLLERTQCLIEDLRRSSPATVLIVAHGWTLQALRVIHGEITADQAAQNVGMPTNCSVIDAWF